MPLWCLCETPFFGKPMKTFLCILILGNVALYGLSAGWFFGYIPAQGSAANKVAKPIEFKPRTIQIDR